MYLVRTKTFLEIVLFIAITRARLDEGYEIPKGTELENARRKFWIDLICQGVETRRVDLYGVSFNRSIRLENFFDDLAQGINRERCNVTIRLRRYGIDVNGTNVNGDDDDDNVDNVVVDRSSFDGKSSMDYSLNTTGNDLKVFDGLDDEIKRRKGGERRNVERRRRGRRSVTNDLDLWSLHVILIKDERSLERILEEDDDDNDDNDDDDESANYWMSRVYFIVMIISDDVDHHVDDGYLETVERTLKILWFRRQILNALVFLPYAQNGSELAYAYDPFIPNDQNYYYDERGKLESINVISRDDILKRLSQLNHLRTENMHGYRLNVGLFQQFQSLMKTRDEPSPGSVYEYSAGYNGTDAVIMGTIARYMNFTVNEINPRDRIKFGHELTNGTYVGTLGDIVYGRADATFASYFVKTYGKGNNNFEFTSQTGYDSICVIVPKARKIPKWLRIHHMFETSVWICSIISPIIIYLMCYALMLFTRQRTKIYDHIKLAYKVFLFAIGYPNKLPLGSCTERILLSALSIINVTMAGLFVGLLYKSFSNDAYYKDIDLLSELDDTELPIVYMKYNLRDVFDDDSDAGGTSSLVLMNLRKKFKYGASALRDVTRFKNASGLIRRKHYHLLEKEMVNDDLSPKLHLVEECPRNYYLAYPIARNSYLLDKLNLLIGRLNQAGLLALWNNRTIVNLINRRRGIPRKRKHAGDKFVPFNLEDVQSSFYLLIIGLLLSSIVFCDERGWLRGRVRKKERRFI